MINKFELKFNQTKISSMVEVPFLNNAILILIPNSNFISNPIFFFLPSNTKFKTIFFFFFIFQLLIMMRKRESGWLDWVSGAGGAARNKSVAPPARSSGDRLNWPICDPLPNSKLDGQKTPSQPAREFRHIFLNLFFYYYYFPFFLFFFFFKW